MAGEFVIWWNTRTRMEQILIGVLIGSTCLFLILLCLKGSSSKAPQQQSCDSPECLTEYLKFKRYTNTSYNPCKNFYDFVCGGLETSRQAEDDFSFLEKRVKQLINVCSSKIDKTDHQIIKLTKKLYQKCIDRSSVTKNTTLRIMREVMTAAGGWPVLQGNDWDESKFNWTNVTYMFRHLGYVNDFFIQINVDRENVNKSDFLLEVLLGDVYDYQYGVINLDVVDVMVEVAHVFGIDTNANITEEFREAHNLQQSLQNLLVFKNDQDYLHLKYTIEEYQILFNEINWLEFINTMLGPNVQVNSSTSAIFPPAEVFKAWFEEISKRPKRVQANYMMWKFVEKMLPYISDEVQYLNLGSAKKLNHNEFCVNTIKELGLLYPALYLVHKKYTKPSNPDNFFHLIESLSNQVKAIFHTRTAIDSDHYRQILEFVKNFEIEPTQMEDNRINIIFNRSIVEPINLEETTFLQLFAQANKNIKTLEYMLLNSDPYYHLPDTYTLLPKYYPSLLTLDAVGLTASDYYIEDRPAYINYAVIASMMAQSIGNVFRDLEDTDKLLTFFGRCVTENNDENYNEQARLAGSLLLGIQFGYTAYEEWRAHHEEKLPIQGIPYTEQQLFWMSSVRTFCNPQNFQALLTADFENPKSKINMVLSHDPKFAADFRCEPGSLMNSKTPCKF